MRIKEEQKQIIRNLADNIYGKNSEVWLFGSRVDDNKKGGDIDLFVETKENKNLKDKLKFLVELKKKIGDQKIDLIIKTPKSNNYEIVTEIKNTGIRLCK